MEHNTASLTLGSLTLRNDASWTYSTKAGHHSTAPLFDDTARCKGTSWTCNMLHGPTSLLICPFLRQHHTNVIQRKPKSATHFSNAHPLDETFGIQHIPIALTNILFWLALSRGIVLAVSLNLMQSVVRRSAHQRLTLNQAPAPEDSTHLCIAGPGRE
eukprot:6468248-Amphidinium_carterae.1